MARPREYPDSVKAAVLAEVDAGGKVHATAARHGVSVAIVYRWLQQRRRGEASPVAPPALGSFRASIRIMLDLSPAQALVDAVPEEQRAATVGWVRMATEEQFTAEFIPQFREELRAKIMAATAGWEVSETKPRSRRRH